MRLLNLWNTKEGHVVEEFDKFKMDIIFWLMAVEDNMCQMSANMNKIPQNSMEHCKVIKYALGEYGVRAYYALSVG